MAVCTDSATRNIAVVGRKHMRNGLLNISRENEARFPIETKQLRAIWKAGYVTANSRYWCKETCLWRSITEFRLGMGMSPDKAQPLIRKYFSDSK
jgi:hypothetical protein